MLKFLLIIILLYLVYQMFLKPVLRSFTSSYTTHQQHRYQERRDGKINIDHVPDNSAEFEEGEYIDYEEVKNK